MNEEVQQQAEWRSRLMADVLSNMHDEETRVAILIAGLDQAHSEGLMDAAWICDQIAARGPSTTRRTADILAKAIRDLDRKNMAYLTAR